MQAKSNKRILTTLLVMLGFILGYGQGLYFGLEGGYALPLGNDQCEQRVNTTENLYFGPLGADYTTKHELVHYSLGQGTQLGGFLGYMFTPHLGAELGLSYLIGSPSTASYELLCNFDHGCDEIWDATTLRAHMLRLSPAIIIKAGFKRFNPYLRLGLTAGSGKVIEEYEHIRTVESNGMQMEDTETKKMILNGGLAWGARAGLGLDLQLGPHWSLFGELSTISMTYAPRYGEVIEAFAGERDLLPAMSLSERETEFLDEVETTYTYESGYVIDPDKPQKAIKRVFPFGNIGLQGGIKFHF